MYNEIYDSKAIRNENSDFTDFVIPHLRADHSVADFGCGTCRKVIKFAPHVNNIVAIDRNESMLKQATQSLEKNHINNVRLFLGDNMNTPFRSHSFDVCTTALSTWSNAEAHRLLKDGGSFFIETLSPDDKSEIKLAFGDDESGARGYLFAQSVDERLHYLLTALGAFFEVEQVRRTEKKTVLSTDGFVDLLEVTPTIRGFSIEKDKDIVKELSSGGSVAFTERRIMIKARAKNIGSAK